MREDRQAFEAIARAGREAVRRVWARRGERERLESPERRLLALLEQHDEFRAYWEGAEPSEDENPFIHVLYHDLLERQLEAGEPREAARALERLLAAGRSRHEALHELLRVLVVEMARMADRRGRFDDESYRRGLEALGREDAG